jgi:cytochrome c oxidase assembly factor CtaG/putative copper export protein
MTQRRYAAVAVVLAGAAALWLLLALGGGAPATPPPGIPDPGALTGWALPLVRFLADLAGIATVGAALVPLLTVDRLTETASSPALRALFSIRRTAALWALLVAAELVLTWSDQFAVPVGQVTWAELSGFARQVSQGRALLVQLVVVLVLAVLSRWLVAVRESSWLLVLAVGALTPPLFTGHSSSSGSHDTAIVSVVVHVLAVSVWVGGIVALWWHLGAAAELRERAARRFSALAAWCFAVVAVSGVVNALVRLGGLTEFVTSDYGRGALVKVVVLGALGLLALRTRRALGDRFLALTLGELALMAVAVALGVGLGRTPPPVGEIYTSAAEDLLGGPVPPAPTAARLLWSWTPSGVGLLVCGLGLAAYVAGVVALRRRGVSWPWWRTLGGLGTYSHVMFSAHMAAHMVLSMAAPILLVLGAPVTLALKALPGGDGPRVQGPRQWLAGALRSRPARLLTHPVVAAVIFVASLYAVYFTGLFEALMRSHLGHAWMEVHFLLAGFLFFEVLVGSAPLPARPSYLGRLMLLLVAMPFHAFFAIAVMSSQTVIGGGYYALLDRGYATDLQADQYLAGSMTWALGEVPMVMVLFVLLAQWFRSDSRAARRSDARAERDGGAELAAYNAMLAGLARGDGGRTTSVDDPATDPEEHARWPR